MIHHLVHQSEIGAFKRSQKSKISGAKFHYVNFNKGRKINKGDIIHLNLDIFQMIGEVFLIYGGSGTVVIKQISIKVKSTYSQNVENIIA